jgi:hypothetical protein
MVGYRPARGLYTLLTDTDLVGHYLLENLCKGLVASLCNHTYGSVVWCLASITWLGSKFFGALTLLVVKVYSLCRV